MLCFVWCALCRLCRNRNGKEMRLIFLPPVPPPKKNRLCYQYYWSWGKNRHCLNIRASRLLWLRGEFLRQIFYLSFGFWGQFSAAESQSHFSSSPNPEPSSIFNSRRRMFPCWSTSLKKRRVDNRFAHFSRSFLLITNIHPAHIPAATSLDWLDIPNGCWHNKLRTVSGNCTYVWIGLQKRSSRASRRQ